MWSLTTKTTIIRMHVAKRRVDLILGEFKGSVCSAASITCYICSGSRVDGLVGVWIPGAVLTERRATAQVSDPRLLVATVGQVGFRCLVEA